MASSKDPRRNPTRSRTNHYVAAESITGTRIASKILELPFNVNVATREFIDDFNLTELNDQIAFMSSVAPSERRSLPGSGQGSVSIRGFTADADLRNGFRRLGGMVAPVSIDRVEVIKGPAAGIYGRIQPGGVVNIVTKRSERKPDHRLLLRGRQLRSIARGAVIDRSRWWSRRLSLPRRPSRSIPRRARSVPPRVCSSMAGCPTGTRLPLARRAMGSEAARAARAV